MIAQDRRTIVSVVSSHPRHQFVGYVGGVMSDFIHKRLADAALHGRYEEARDLVRRGGPALVNHRDVAGYSALHRAAAGGRVQVRALNKGLRREGLY